MKNKLLIIFVCYFIVACNSSNNVELENDNENVVINPNPPIIPEPEPEPEITLLKNRVYYNKDKDSFLILSPEYKEKLFMFNSRIEYNGRMETFVDYSFNYDDSKNLVETDHLYMFAEYDDHKNGDSEESPMIYFKNLNSNLKINEDKVTFNIIEKENTQVQTLYSYDHSEEIENAINYFNLPMDYNVTNQEEFRVLLREYENDIVVRNPREYLENIATNYPTVPKYREDIFKYNKLIDFLDNEIVFEAQEVFTNLKDVPTIDNKVMDNEGLVEFNWATNKFKIAMGAMQDGMRHCYFEGDLSVLESNSGVFKIDNVILMSGEDSYGWYPNCWVDSLFYNYLEYPHLEYMRENNIDYFTLYFSVIKNFNDSGENVLVGGFVSDLFQKNEKLIDYCIPDQYHMIETFFGCDKENYSPIMGTSILKQ